MIIKMPDTDKRGNPFSVSILRLVWNKALVVEDADPLLKRKDVCRGRSDWKKYGNANPGGTGWETDHIRPVAKGGDDYPDNLQLLQWQNKRLKSDRYPGTNYSITTANH